jgi:hypothetical protein
MARRSTLKLVRKDLTRRANQGHICIVATMQPAPETAAGIFIRAAEMVPVRT